MTKIEFVTNTPLAMDYPPVPIKKVIPDWYKEMDTHYADKRFIDDARWYAKTGSDSAKTIRGCVPVLDYLTTGYVIRSHSQSLITPDKSDDTLNFSWISSDQTISSHPHQQCPIHINGVKNMYFKFVNTWVIKTPPGYSCLFYQPEYLMETRYTLFPGIVDTDGFDQAINFPGVVTTDKSFYINPSDPIMAVFPFKRDEWDSSCRLMSETEKNAPSKLRHYLFDKYKTIFHNKKLYR